MAMRFLFPALLASGVTAMLFWTMTVMIAVQQLELAPEKRRMVPWVRVRPDSPPEPILRKTIVRPPAPDETIPIDVIDTEPGGVTIPIGPADGPLALPEDGQRPRLIDADGDAVPLVRIPPRYPEAALARGIEGRVLVEFTITASGSVRDARVIAAEPARLFDASALEAVRQWRYTPRIVDGLAVERPGMRISIPFRRGEDASG